MIISGSWRKAAAAIVLYGLSAPAVGVAAEFRLERSDKGQIGAVLEGKIETGDFDKFEAFILGGENAPDLYLASPGGNLGEAMKIGMLVRLLKLSTLVPSKTLTNQQRTMAITRHSLKDPRADYMCSSACFFIFVAGVYRAADDIGPPILGIHRPFLPGKDVQSLRMNNTTANEERIRKAVDSYLEAMDVPAQYSEEMFSVPKGKISWIRDDEFISDFAGFIPPLKEQVRSRCEPVVGEKANDECRREMLNELSLQAYSDTIKKGIGKR